MASHQEGIRKIIWAVDALDPDSKAQTPVTQVLRVLAQATGAQVQPVYFFTLANVMGGFRLSDIEIQLHSERAEKHLKEIVQRARIPTLLPPRIVFERANRLRDAATGLWKYAIQESGDMIVVATHGHWGLRRLFMGSFAETLVLTSSVPVLTISPETRAKRRLRHILFPTDLGSYAEFCFGKALSLAKQLGAQITVFHSAPIPSGLAVHQGIRSYERMEKEFAGEWWKEYRQHQKGLDAYIERARHMGLKAKCFLDASGLGLTSAILSAANKMKIDLISMPAQSGSFRAIFAGSTTRQVTRTAPCPVWVLHEAPSELKGRVAA